MADSSRWHSKPERPFLNSRHVRRGGGLRSSMTVLPEPPMQASHPAESRLPARLIRGPCRHDQSRRAPRQGAGLSCIYSASTQIGALREPLFSMPAVMSLPTVKRKTRESRTGPQLSPGTPDYPGGLRPGRLAKPGSHCVQLGFRNRRRRSPGPGSPRRCRRRADRARRNRRPWACLRY